MVAHSGDPSNYGPLSSRYSVPLGFKSPTLFLALGFWPLCVRARDESIEFPIKTWEYGLEDGVLQQPEGRNGRPQRTEPFVLNLIFIARLLLRELEERRLARCAGGKVIIGAVRGDPVGNGFPGSRGQGPRRLQHKI